MPMFARSQYSQHVASRNASFLSRKSRSPQLSLDLFVSHFYCSVSQLHGRRFSAIFLSLCLGISLFLFHKKTCTLRAFLQPEVFDFLNNLINDVSTWSLRIRVQSAEFYGYLPEQSAEICMLACESRTCLHCRQSIKILSTLANEVIPHTKKMSESFIIIRPKIIRLICGCVWLSEINSDA